MNTITLPTRSLPFGSSPRRLGPLVVGALGRVAVEVVHDVHERLLLLLERGRLRAKHVDLRAQCGRFVVRDRVPGPVSSVGRYLCLLSVSPSRFGVVVNFGIRLLAKSVLTIRRVPAHSAYRVFNNYRLLVCLSVTLSVRGVVCSSRKTRPRQIKKV